MKCSIDGCPGEYEAGKVMHTVRHHGQVMWIKTKPKLICRLTDVPFEAKTFVPYAETCFYDRTRSDA